MAGRGYGVSGYAGESGRIEWDEKAKSGSVEWGRDAGFERNGYNFGYGAPYRHRRPRRP